MASRRTKLISSLTVAVLAAGGYFVYSAFAVQGQGALAQAPLNFESQVTPAFIIAADDSGSMQFHNQFPGADGKACWTNPADGQPLSFFNPAGQLYATRRTSNTAAGHVCNYAYSYGGTYRLPGNHSATGNNYVGLVPIDRFGFARSPEFNPAYFDPETTYEPWLNYDGTSYAQADPRAVLIDPTGHVKSAAGGSDANWTLDLTQPYDRTFVGTTNGRLDDRYVLKAQMVVPAGTKYQTEASAGCGGLTGGGVWVTATTDIAIPANTTCVVFIEHYLPTFFLKESTPVPAGYAGVARELVNNACGTGCNMWKYTIGAADAVAMQNFANWFQYYNNRHKSLIAGLTHSLVDVNNMRIGYFRISQHGSFDQPDVTTALNPSGHERVHMRHMEVPTDKQAIYTQVLARPAWSGTTNRQAVYAAGQQFKRTDPTNSLQGGAPVQLACQKNAMMLFTDGYSNNDGPTVGNIDTAMGTPFSDGHDNTLADIAATYYLNTGSGQSPLRTDLPAGQVRVPSGCPSTDPSIDCQSNLHVNFYGVTLNGRGNLYDPDNLLDPYTNPAVYNHWPARQNDNRSTIDDIWHAAVNTRGQLINARTPADITAAMRQILGAVAEGTTPSGSIGITGARIGSGSLSVEPFYESRNFATDWYSTLTAQRPETHPITGEVNYVHAWEASALLPAPAARNVWYSRAGATPAQFRSTASLSLDDLCNSPSTHSLCTAASITSNIGVDVGQAITYLLGDQTNEEGRTGGTGKLRFRTTRLGSIINSSPVLSSPTDDFGYRALMSTDDPPVSDRFNYSAYLAVKSARPPMIYVGANDGMLHAFDGRSDANGGIERFAYIPSTALGHMGNLLLPLAGKDNDPDFKHRYFVDGPITVADAYHGATWGGGGSGWKTVLVGTAGAGGRSVFALNVSDPAGFNAGSRLWELGPHSDIAIQRDLGHVLGKPVVVPVKSIGGAVSWKAIFGNGYGSPNGNAVLFVVDIATGAVQRIQANESVAPAGSSNGIGNIVAVDRYTGDNATLNLTGRDGYADTVYAADQKGALWRFDLRPTTPTVSSAPVFVTATQPDGYRQPITGGLTAALAPGGGVMVYFGTGSFSFVGDKEDLSMQSLYGVIDRGLSTTLDRSNLTAQTVTVGPAGSTSRVVTRNAMSAGSRGWYVDLPAGERMVSHPRIENGIVFMPTYDPAVSDGCSGLGNNWLYGLNALSGGAALSGVSVGSPTGDPYGAATGAVALATGGTAPVKEVAVLTSPRLPPLAAGATAAELDAALAAQCSMLVQVAGAPPLYMPRACGRQSWRQIR
ncbi:PilC/PilY family type IV pilus protein [Stenotrophomonas sp. Marseille-Q4652]|uniref:pilus assembly protein n=1 Tax=Stenotrophomonas sp. Marseille-Q4652 TaxID=2866595 RepID=UPI001CE3F69F|nr:PilC/PilY family type IV pilus protein [Stenotrophomonas sp. Marseille-Q4652]